MGEPTMPWSLGDLGQVDKNGLRVMSTFACGGGSSMGYKLAGYDVVAGNDIDPRMARHYKKNLNPELFFLCPVRGLMERSDLPKNIDLLDGSPPCSSFSTSGLRSKVWGEKKRFREGQAMQVLDDLFFDYLDLVELMRPKVVVAENVSGLMTGKAKGYLRLIFARLREIGYRPQAHLIDASRCGVPQRRRRVFVTALRLDIERPRLKISASLPVIPVERALRDVRPTQPELLAEGLALTIEAARLHAHTVPGEHFGNTVVRRGLKKSRFSEYRLLGTVPANTMTATAALMHWDEPRKLSLRECIRIGTFPDDYEFESPAIGKYMIGMSVPPLMAQLVAACIRDQWLS